MVLGDLQYCERVPSDFSVHKSGAGSTVNAVAAVPSGIVPPSEHRKQVSALLDISSEAVSPKQVHSLRELPLEFHDQFALSEHELGEANGVLHHVDTCEHPPHAENVRWFLPALEDEIDKNVQEWCDFGTCELPNSEWAANVVPVQKPLTKEIRLSVNWKPLNLHQPKDRYLLPSCVWHIDDASAKGVKIFSTLETWLSYLQIFLDEESMEKTQFRKGKGMRKGTFEEHRRAVGSRADVPSVAAGDVPYSPSGEVQVFACAHQVTGVHHQPVWSAGGFKEIGCSLSVLHTQDSTTVEGVPVNDLVLPDSASPRQDFQFFKYFSHDNIKKFDHKF